MKLYEAKNCSNSFFDNNPVKIKVKSNELAENVLDESVKIRAFDGLVKEK